MGKGTERKKQEGRGEAGKGGSTRLRGGHLMIGT